MTRTPPSGPEERVARMVLDQCLGVRRGETVTVETWDHTLPWARAFVLEARRRGCEPTLVVEDEEAFFRSLALPGSRPVPLAPVALAEQSDAYVYFGGPEAFPRLFGLPPDDLETILLRHGPSWGRAARRVGLRAARMAIAAATPTAATRYGVDLEGWQREVIQASLVPPERLARAAERLARTLARARRVRVHHPNGTDLEVELQPGASVVEDGRVDRADRRAGRVWTQIPTGLLAVPLAEGGANGTWEANRPVYDRFQNPPVAVGARFTFVRGRLREYGFDRGGEGFVSAYARGGRGRDVPSALTFGLNPALSRAPELGEIAAGTVGLLLGDNRAIGGRNRSRFTYLTTLREADVDLDGVPGIVGGRWWAPAGKGRAVRTKYRRRVPLRVQSVLRQVVGPAPPSLSVGDGRPAP